MTNKVTLRRQTHPAIVTDDLVLHLDAFDTAGYGGTNTITDLTGNKNNGTLTNGTYHTDGPFVGAGSVEFVKSDNDGFTVSNSTGWFNPNNTSQWTLEGWILNPSTTNVFAIYSGTWGQVANFGCAIGGSVSFQSGPGSWSWTTNTTLVSDTGSPTGWNHFAFTKNGSTFEVFLNGSRIYTGTPTFGTGTTGGSIHLQSYFSNTQYFNDAEGLSNVRYVSGSVLYSGTSYTIPTEPLTAIGGTQLLIYQGTAFTDASPNRLTLTKQNSPTATLAFPASSFEFDGTDDYIDIGSTDIPAGPLTVSAWVNVGADVSIATIAASNGDWILGTTSRRPFAYNYASAVQVTAPSGDALSIGTWYNVVMVQGSSLDIYINGSQAATNSDSTDMTATEDLDIGRRAGNNDRYHNGKIAQLSIYKKALTSTEITQNYNALKWRYE